MACLRKEVRLGFVRRILLLEDKDLIGRVCFTMDTHENRFIALSRLSNVAIASAND